MKEETTIQVDFTELVLSDLEGNPITDFHKTIANRIYYSDSQNLDLVPISLEILKGIPVEIRESDLEAIEAIIMGKNARVAVFARKAFKEFIQKIRLEALKK